jgi:hypothetical protein
VVPEVSEHGLGHLLSPLGPKDKSKRWRDEGWEWVMGLSQEPSWFVLPAVSRISVSSPHVLRAFDGFNAHRSRDEQIRPFNFCLSAHVAPFGHPEGVDPLGFHLIAPYSDDPRTYLTLDWVDRFSGEAYPVTTIEDSGRSGPALLQTYGTVFSRYARHLEAKSLDSAGRPGRGSGLLLRRPVREGSRAFVGKESNRIEEVEMGLLHQLDDVIQEYGLSQDPWRSYVVHVLRQIPVSLITSETGLDRRTVQRLRSGRSQPRRRNEAALTRVAGDWARQRLGAEGLAAPRSDVLACRAWLESTVLSGDGIGC